MAIMTMVEQQVARMTARFCRLMSRVGRAHALMVVLIVPGAMSGLHMRQLRAGPYLINEVATAASRQNAES